MVGADGPNLLRVASAELPIGRTRALTGRPESLWTIPATAAQDVDQPTPDVVGDRRVEFGERP